MIKILQLYSFAFECKQLETMILDRVYMRYLFGFP